MSGGRRRPTITRHGFFADPVWDASPCLSIDDDLDQAAPSEISTDEDDKDQEESERSPGMEDGGDFHINATLPSLKEAVKNGLLDDAFREGVKDEDRENIETSDDDEDLAIAHKASDVSEAKKMFRKNPIATSTSPMYRKLVRNFSPV